MPLFAELSTLAFVALLSWAAASDIFTQLIPNRVSVFIAVAFIMFAVSPAFPAVKILAHFACAFIVLGCGFALYARSIIGGGDAKLFAAAALWFGFEPLAQFLALTGIAGGVVAVTYLTRNAVYAGVGIDGRWTRTIPYGAAIAAGALIMLSKGVGL